MAALVETMFSVREKPWHGLGTIVSEAPDSQKALELAGLDWNVIQKDIITADGSSVIPGFKANVRDRDNSVLGIVTDRYKVVQNSEAFAFTDELLGEGVRYETAGSLQGGSPHRKFQSPVPVVRRLLSFPAHTERRQNQSHPHPYRSRSSGNADPASCLGFYRYGTGNKPSRSGLHGFHNAPQPVLL